jgi:hypothetical protein
VSAAATAAAAVEASEREAVAAGSARRPQLLPLLLATLAYLAVEFAFAARLLDVTGGVADADAIAAIARWGRLISGIALTLAVWGSLLLPMAARRGWAGRRTAAALVLSAAACLGFAWAAEKALVDHIVASSDGGTRRTAAQLRLLSGAVLDGSARLSGVDLSPEALARPEGKAFLAIFPFIAMSSDGVADQPDAIMRQVHRSFAERRYGTAEQVYNGLFIPSVRSVRDAFGRYVAAQRRLVEAAVAGARQADQAWARYLAALAERGLTPARVPPEAAAAAIEAARAAGAPVADDWQPADGRGFAQAVAGEALAAAQAAYEADVVAAIGSPLPPGLDWTAFTESTPVQTRWRAFLGAESDAVLSSSMGFEAFRDRVYDPALDHAVRRAVQDLTSPDRDWEDGGRYAEAGRAAVQWLVIPPLALALSLVGALVHLFKVANFSLLLTAPALKRRRTMLALATIALGSCAYLAPNPISSSEAFHYFEARTLRRFGVVAAAASRWIVQAEPLFYPVGETARRVLLVGYDFGWGSFDGATGATRALPTPAPWATGAARR